MRRVVPSDSGGFGAVVVVVEGGAVVEVEGARVVVVEDVDVVVVDAVVVVLCPSGARPSGGARDARGQHDRWQDAQRRSMDTALDQLSNSWSPSPVLTSAPGQP